MKTRVLLNKTTLYLHITTTDYIDDNLLEIFSCINEDPVFGMLLCKIFCQGYIQGNIGVKINNSAEDFK